MWLLPAGGMKRQDEFSPNPKDQRYFLPSIFNCCPPPFQVLKDTTEGIIEKRFSLDREVYSLTLSAVKFTTSEFKCVFINIFLKLMNLSVVHELPSEGTCLV